jgi:hypothetical protein
VQLAEAGPEQVAFVLLWKPALEPAPAVKLERQRASGPLKLIHSSADVGENASTCSRSGAVVDGKACSYMSITSGSPNTDCVGCRPTRSQVAGVEVEVEDSQPLPPASSCRLRENPPSTK